MASATMCRDVLTLCDGYNCAFGDDYRYCCILEAGHSGPHRDEFEHDGKSVVVTWQETDNDTVGIANSEHLLLVRPIEAPVEQR